MNKLLGANFSRMMGNKIFWICMALMAGMGAILPYMHYRTMLRDGYTMNIDAGFFVCAIYIGILLSVFVSLFLGTEYSDGTIRNKIIVGQKRSAIYFANLITCMAAGMLMCGVYFLAYLCVGLPLLGTFQSAVKLVLLLTAGTFAISFAFSSLFAFVSMINQSKAGSAVICILTAFLLVFSGIYINTRLQEPEFYDDYLYMDEAGNVQTEEAAPNPTYIKGTKRSIYEFLNDFLPGGQAFQVAGLEDSGYPMMMVYSLLIVIGTTGAGLLLFQKKNLK